MPRTGPTILTPQDSGSPIGRPAAPTRSRVLRRLRSQLFASGTIVVLVLEFLVFWSLSPTFGTWDNTRLVLEQSALLGLVALGLTFTLVVLDFDLSVGAIFTLGGVVAAKTGVHHGWVLAVAAGCGVGVAVGVVNGAIVTGFGISAFIATIGTTALITGLVDKITGNVDVVGISSSFLKVGDTRVANIDSSVFVVLAFALFAVFLLNRTDAGRRINAIGGNAEAARLVGISVSRYRILAFALSGFGAALGGTLLAAQTASGSTSAGTDYLLPAFTACFLGAVTRSGGQFNPLGTMVGVLILTVTTNGLIHAGAASYWQSIVSGAILIAAVAVSGVSQRVSGR
jgi:ribose transport system permease protein